MVSEFLAGVLLLGGSLLVISLVGGAFGFFAWLIFVLVGGYLYIDRRFSRIEEAVANLGEQQEDS